MILSIFYHVTFLEVTTCPKFFLILYSAHSHDLRFRTKRTTATFHHVGIETALVQPFMTDRSWWNLSLCSSLTLPRLKETNSSGNAKNAFLKTYDLLIAHKLSACDQQHHHIFRDGDFPSS